MLKGPRENTALLEEIPLIRLPINQYTDFLPYTRMTIDTALSSCGVEQAMSTKLYHNECSYVCVWGGGGGCEGILGHTEIAY